MKAVPATSIGMWFYRTWYVNAIATHSRSSFSGTSSPTNPPKDAAASCVEGM
jgi:hypothetical protein